MTINAVNYFSNAFFLLIFHLFGILKIKNPAQLSNINNHFSFSYHFFFIFHTLLNSFSFLHLWMSSFFLLPLLQSLSLSLSLFHSFTLFVYSCLPIFFPLSFSIVLLAQLFLLFRYPFSSFFLSLSLLHQISVISLYLIVFLSFS